MGSTRYGPDLATHVTRGRDAMLNANVSTAADRASPGVLRVAMAQIAPVLGDLQRNLALHVEQIEAARRQHADLVVFPELSLTGYFVRDMVPDLAISPAGPEIRQLIEAAGPDVAGGRVGRGVAAASILQRRALGRGRPGASTSIARSICPPMGCSTSSGILPPASDSWRSTRRGSAGWAFCLRGFLAPFGRRHHAGRRGRPADLHGQFARPRRRRPEGPHRPKPTSNLPRRLPNCSARR